MSIIDQLRTELQDMTQEERKELADLIAGKENVDLPARELGAPLGRNKTGPRGEELTEEQYYDYTHPLTGLWPANAYDIVQNFDGKKTRINHSKKEIAAHNWQIFEAWLKKKREYAAKYGLEFSDEYNPPEDRRGNHIRVSAMNSAIQNPE